MAHFEETAIGYKAIFQQTFNDTASEADVLATEVKSNDLSEKYAWLGNFPNMKEWIGDRDVKTLTDFGYALENKLFEASITVPNTHIEYDKIGLYKPAVQQMAMNAKVFGSILVAQVLLDATDAVKGKCYDGKPFYAADHVVGETTYSNSENLELNATNIEAADAFMRSIKGGNGQSLRIVPNTLVIGPMQLSTATRLIGSEKLDGGESNPNYKKYNIIVLPEITGLEWHLMDLSKPLKPFIKQVAKDGEFESSDGDKFMRDHALFGTKSFMNVGYGLWQLSYRGSGVAA